MMITITSHENLDKISHSLPLLVGEVIGVDEGELEVQCNSENASIWPVVKGKFKALVNLVPGQNDIVFKCNSAVKELCVVYEPLTIKKFVRLVYIICADDEGYFQAPNDEDSSPASACARIVLGAQMLQTFTALKLNDHGLGFKTFRLEEDFGQPICHIFKSNLILDEALKLTENELWNHFALELMKSPLRVGNDCKFLAFLSFTRYENATAETPKSFDEVKSMTQGYVALATGGLALLGSGCLHTWPQNLSEVPWRFGDTRKIDQMQFMDDSGNRGTHWGCYSTNLGATIHELGHVFNLGHTPEGVMSRGFDNMQRFYIVDLFYCRHPFQKKYNPYYQSDIHEQDSTVSFVNAEEVTWGTDQQNVTLPVADADTRPAGTETGQNDNSSKPPWRIPDPERTGLASDNKMDGPFWARSSALILHYHKWLNDYEESDDIQSITRTGTTFDSTKGIRIVEYRDEKGMAFHHLEFLDGEGVPQVDILNIDEEGHQIDEKKNVTVHVQDSAGNICVHTFAQVTL